MTHTPEDLVAAVLQLALAGDWDAADALADLAAGGGDEPPHGAEVGESIGPPPHPDLVFDRSRHRWVRPEGTDGGHADTPYLRLLRGDPKRALKLVVGDERAVDWARRTPDELAATVAALREAGPRRLAKVEATLADDWREYLKLHGRDAALTPEDLDTDFARHVRHGLALVRDAMGPPAARESAPGGAVP
jgi:hypothetical protein